MCTMPNVYISLALSARSSPASTKWHSRKKIPRKCFELIKFRQQRDSGAKNALKAILESEECMQMDSHGSALLLTDIWTCGYMH